MAQGCKDNRWRCKLFNAPRRRLLPPLPLCACVVKVELMRSRHSWAQQHVNKGAAQGASRHTLDSSPARRRVYRGSRWPSGRGASARRTTSSSSSPPSSTASRSSFLPRRRPDRPALPPSDSGCPLRSHLRLLHSSHRNTSRRVGILSRNLGGGLMRMTTFKALLISGWAYIKVGG